MLFDTFETTAEWVKQYCTLNNITSYPIVVFEGIPLFEEGVAVTITRTHSSADIVPNLAKKSATFTKWFEKNKAGFIQLFQTLKAGIALTSDLQLDGVWHKNSKTSKNEFIVYSITITSFDQPTYYLSRKALSEILGPYKDTDFKIAFDYSSWAATVDFGNCDLNGVVQASLQIKEETGANTIAWIPSSTEDALIQDMGKLPFVFKCS